MDEGSALLHHLERRFNRWLCSVVIGNDVAKDALSYGNKDDETLVVCGSDGMALDDVIRQAKAMLPGFDSRSRSVYDNAKTVTVHETPYPLTRIDDGLDDFRFRLRFLLFVCRMETFQDSNELNRLLHIYRHTKRRGGSVLMLVVMENDDVTALNSVIRAHPELTILYCTKRIYTVAKQREGQLLHQASSVVHDWLSGVLPDDSGALEKLDYADIFKIVVRDVHQAIPGLTVLFRLTTMVTGGLAAVLLTVILLAMVSHESPVTLDVRQGVLRLRTTLESQRSGKNEWGWRDTPSAIVALQLNDPSWCFSRDLNHRSVDRMEIAILSEMSRFSLASQQRRRLTPSVLSAYINALLAVYQSPRSFHSQDLVSTLVKYMDDREGHVMHDNFVYGSYVIAVYNAGLQLDRKHVTRLLARQRQDGSFPLGPEEAAITLIALTCFDSGHVPRDAFDLTWKYLMRQRQSNGSYGSLLSTSFITQVANSTPNAVIAPDDLQVTIKWLVQQTGSDVIRKNVHLAANLLMALKGKSLTSVRNLTGYELAREVAQRFSFSIGPDTRTSSFPPSTVVFNRYIIPEENSGTKAKDGGTSAVGHRRDEDAERRWPRSSSGEDATHRKVNLSESDAAQAENDGEGREVDQRRDSTSPTGNQDIEEKQPSGDDLLPNPLLPSSDSTSSNGGNWRAVFLRMCT